MRTVHAHAEGLRGSRRGGRLRGRHYGDAFVGLVCVVMEGECPMSLKPNRTLVWSLVGDSATSVEALKVGARPAILPGATKISQAVRSGGGALDPHSTPRNPTSGFPTETHLGTKAQTNTDITCKRNKSDHVKKSAQTSHILIQLRFCSLRFVYVKIMSVASVIPLHSGLP